MKIDVRQVVKNFSHRQNEVSESSQSYQSQVIKILTYFMVFSSAIIRATFFVLLCSMAGLFMMPTCEAGCIQGTMLNDYKSQIEKFLSGEDGYKDQPEYLECVTNKILYTISIGHLTSERNLIDIVKSIKGDMEFNCDLEQFILSPIGIVTGCLLILVGVFCMCVEHYRNKSKVYTLHIPADYRKNEDLNLTLTISEKNPLCK